MIQRARPNEPSRPAAEDSEANEAEWRAQPGLAWLLRAAIIIVPLFVSWLAVRAAVIVVPRPAGWLPTLAWILSLLALSMLLFEVTRRMVGRFSSLGVLLGVSLTFPDAAPSRTRIALDAGRSEVLETDFSAEISEDARTAKALAGLLAKVTRHEGRSLGHGDRVRGYVELIADELDLPADDRKKLRWATMLHDVGMLGVPEHIVHKRGALNDDERALIQLHPRHAEKQLAPVVGWLGPWAGAAFDHHERWDGTGYPTGLSATEISLAGRIVAVADAYDAMTARRTYQRRLTPAAARQELVDNAGSQFDPDVVRAFLNANIEHRRLGLGPLGALLELPAHLWALVPRVAGGVNAGATAAGAAALTVAAVTGPTISSRAELPPPAVERVVETTTTTTSTTTTTTTTTTTLAPTTTRPTTTTTTTTTTTVPPTTRPPTTTAPPTTAPPTTQAPTTTAPPTDYPTPTTTTTTPPIEYPSI